MLSVEPCVAMYFNRCNYATERTREMRLVYTSFDIITECHNHLDKYFTRSLWNVTPISTSRGSVPNAEYAPKLEYLDILLKMIDISELVDECVCVESAVCFTVMFIFLGIVIFLLVNFETFIKHLLFIINTSF